MYNVDPHNDSLRKKVGRMKNIEFFDVCVAHIANRLYDDFPRCVDISTDKETNHPYFENVKLFKDRALIMTHTLFWLRENGFLEFTEPKGKPTGRDECTEMFYCVRLTSKGLMILKSPPQSIESHETIGEALGTSLMKSAADKGATMAVEIVSALATGAFRMATGV